MKKRFLVLLYAAVMTLTALFGTVSLPVHAEGTGSLVLYANSAERGENVGIGLALTANPGSMATLKLLIEYSDGLEFLGVTPSEDVFPSSTLTTSQTIVTYPYVLSWIDGLSDRTENGMLVTLNFKVRDNCPIGHQAVTVRFAESFDFNGGTNTFGNVTNYIDVWCSHATYRYTAINEKTHTRVCASCGESDVQNHLFTTPVVTKEPTYDAPGERTYTCVLCGGTKKETVAPLKASYQLTSWTWAEDLCSASATFRNTDDASDVRTVAAAVTKKTTDPTCEKQGKTVYTASVTFRGGSHSDTKEKTVSALGHSFKKIEERKATCAEDGWIRYSCTNCGQVKNETLPKTGHLYGGWTAKDGSVHERSCRICGKTESVSHDFGASWSNDGTDHWHECSVCGEKKDGAKHALGMEPTETSPQVCTVCGRILKPALGHSHEWSESWEYDKTEHWHACSGCSERNGVAKHVFDNDCDEDCNECGYRREAEHKWLLKSDRDGHWYECSACGEIRDREAHVTGEGAGTGEPGICEICGYESTMAPEQEESDPESAPETFESNQESAPEELSEEEDPSRSKGESSPAESGEADSRKTEEAGSVIPWIVGAVILAAVLAAIFFIRRGRKREKA